MKKAAALALHNQPFGFTREDVNWLRTITEYTEYSTHMDEEQIKRTEFLADRIEALLPPEKK